jgi:hypothetical protein
VSNGNPGHLDNANNNASSLLSQLAGLVDPTLRNSLHSPKQLLAIAMQWSEAEAAKTAVSQVQSELAQLRTKIDELTNAYLPNDRSSQLCVGLSVAVLECSGQQG